MRGQARRIGREAVERVEFGGIVTDEAAIAAGVLVASAAPRDAIAQSQPNLLASLGAVWGRRLAMRLAGLAVPDDRGLPLLREWLALSVKEKAQSVGGTLRRIMRNRLWRPVVIAPAGSADLK